MDFASLGTSVTRMAPRRATQLWPCMRCSASLSQTSFTQSDGYCLINGVCHAHGESGSICQYCDVTQSMNSWSVREGFYVAQGVCRSTTWTTQSSKIPEFDWVVIDHGDGFYYPKGHAVTADAVFMFGVAWDASIVMSNPETGT